MPSIQNTYTIADFIEWNRKSQLVLSPDFQRGSVWTPAAKVFLIDTILNDLPMPQVFFRSKIDPLQQTTIREVVDGQQRLRAILEFASNRLRLTAKAPKFKDKFYSDLDAEEQEKFLSYKVQVVQLVNATDADVLEVFARLNSYSVKVTPAELRHAEYSEPVKWAIYETTNAHAELWELSVVSVRDCVRLKHTSLVAEMFMCIDVGFNDGGEAAIDRYYKVRKTHGDDHFNQLKCKVDAVLTEIVDRLKYDFVDTTFFDAPNFLCLFAVVAFLKGWAPMSKVSVDRKDAFGAGVSWARAYENLALMSQAVQEGVADNSDRYYEFVSATKSSTHRVSSRKPRFEILVDAIRADVAY